MSTPLDHPLRQTIAAMARTRDALVELARRIDETGLGPVNEGRGIGDATPNSEVFATQGATSPAHAPGPRRWWLNVYHERPGLLSVYHTRSEAEAVSRDRFEVDLEPADEWVEVVEASAYEAVVRERDVALTEVERLTRRYNQASRDLAYYRAHVVVKLEEERDKAVADLASLRRVIWQRAPEMQQLNAAIEGRGCYDPALTVAQNALAYIEQLGEWLDKRTESANALLAERDAARAELADVRRAYDAACAYISVNVCDNDTTAEMWRAWEVFDAERRALDGR